MDPLKIVKRFYTEIWNAGRLSSVPEICHEDLSFCGSLGETKHGHQGFIEYVNSV